MNPHRVFGEGQGVKLLAFLSMLQNLATDKGQLLQANAISPAEVQIGANGKRNSDPVRRNAFEREDPKFPLLLEIR